MTDRIFIEGKTYDSVGGVAREFGLTRDYLMRLCREGKVGAQKNKSGWYVDKTSLTAFASAQERQRQTRYEELAKERAEEYKQHQFATSVGEEKHVDGVRHVSIVEAAEQSGLTQEYVMTLCRKGSIGARRIGKQWYVDASSLHSYVISQEYKRALKKQKLSEARTADYQAPFARHAPMSSIRTEKQIQSVFTAHEFLQKCIALTIALSLTFGTYAVADRESARFALETVARTGTAISTTHHLASEYFSRLSVATQKQLAAAADDPTGSVALGTYFLARSLSDSATWLARSVNTSVNTLVYGIAFPNSLIESNASVAVEIAPYAQPAPAPTPSPATTPTRVGRTGPTTVVRNATTTVVNRPTGERIIERERVVQVGGITEEYLAGKLQELDNKLSSQIFSVTAVASTPPASGGVVSTIALTHKIDNLDGITVKNSTITGGSITDADITDSTISGGTLSPNTLTVSGTGTLATTTITARTATDATTTNFFATNASTTNATSTNFFAVLSNLT